MLSKEASSTIFWVFGMTRPGIEPNSPRAPVNTLTIMPMSGIGNILFSFTVNVQQICMISFPFCWTSFFNSYALWDWHLHLNFLSNLVFNISLLQLINMTLIFPFWAAYHVNKLSNPFHDHSSLPKTFTLPIQLEKHLVSNIKCLGFIVRLVAALYFLYR